MLATFWEFNDRLGRPVVRAVQCAIDALFMTYTAFRTVVTGQTQGLRTLSGVVAAQVCFTGWEAMPLVGLLALATGSTVVMQAAGSVSRFANSQAIGQVLVTFLVCDMAPLLIAMIIVARSGAAITCEVGNMKVSQEIAALESMGINPVSYIIFPRVIGGLLAQFCLAFTYCVTTLTIGFLALYMAHEVPISHFMNIVSSALSPDQMAIFLIKNFFDGVVVAVVCCYQGLSLTATPSAVPQATTRAVVSSMICIISFNIFVTMLFYFKGFIRLGIL